MKLYMVDYMDDCEYDSYLTIGESKEEVEAKEKKYLSESLACLMYVFVYEIKEVDGYEILLKKRGEINDDNGAS